jgi:hypothetical protein
LLWSGGPDEPDSASRDGEAYNENRPQPDSDGLKDLEREFKELREREEAIIELMKRRLVKISDGQQEIEQDIRPKLGVIR